MNPKNFFGSLGIGTVLLLIGTLTPARCLGQTLQFTVPAKANPWLAGMPAGSLPDGIDTVPAESPVQLTGFNITSGATFLFTVTGTVAHQAGQPDGPDGGAIVTRTAGAKNGMANITAPIESLIGVFLDGSVPNAFPPGAALDFSTAASRAFNSFSPLLRQPFFIGSGGTIVIENGSDRLHQFIAPSGATRLFLGVMNSSGWSDNSGSFSVTAEMAVPPNQIVCSVPVCNSGFELPPTPFRPGNWTEVDGPVHLTPDQNFTIPGWGVSLPGEYSVGYGGAGLQWNYEISGIVAWINYGGTINNAIFQDVGPLVPNTTYSLTVACGGHPGAWGVGGKGMIALVNGTDNSGTVLTQAGFGPVQGYHPLSDISVQYTTGASVHGDLTIVLGSVPVIPGTNYQVDFDNVRLVETPVVSPAIVGTVSRNDTQQGLGDVAVEADQSGQPVATTKTDVNGNYQLSSLAPGTYDVKATLTDFLTGIGQGIRVGANQIESLSFSLEPKPPAPPVQTVSRIPASTLVTLPLQAQSIQLKIFPVGGKIDPSKMTIVLTHGLILKGATGPTGVDSWPTDMASNFIDSIRSNVTVPANVVAWDWRDDATDTFPPNRATQRTRDQGEALALALIAALEPGGTPYQQKIHFLGHSLGTLVNGYAADYLHGDLPNQNVHLFNFNNTEITLFDEAEIAKIGNGIQAFFSGAPPLPQNFARADNYISAVGLLHPGATNVILNKGFPASAPDADSLFNALTSFHGYPMTWYEGTISQPMLAVGNSWAFERINGTQQPGQDAFFTQDSSDEFNLQSILAIEAERVVIFRLGNESLSYLTDGARAKGVEIAGDVVDNVEQTVFTDHFEYVTTPATLGIPSYPTKPVPAWTDQLILRPPTTFPNVELIKQQSLSATASSTNTYAWMTMTIPARANQMTFEFSFQNMSQDGYLVMGINDTNLFTTSSRFFALGSTNDAGLLDVSAWGGQQVELFFGLLGGSSTNGSAIVDSIRFYQPEAPSLRFDISGTNALVSWPISAGNFMIERTAQLSGTNQWITSSNLPAITNLEYRVSSGLTNDTGFFRLRQL